MKFRAALAMAVLFALSPACSSAPGASSTISENGLETVPLSIAMANGKILKFNVEVAASAEQQERGLMFRENLGPFQGMLFPFPQPRPASFWMKNTVIPLDIVFVRKDGTIARIVPETVPYSLEMVESGEPVAAVLEIAGGRAAQLGISENDKVTW